MRFWRKRNQGFEWHEYVRTTILLRRQDRRQKVEDVRAAAVQQVKEGGRQGLDAAAAGAGAVAGGIVAASKWAWSHFANGLRWSAGKLASGAAAAARGVMTGASAVLGRVVPGAARAADDLRYRLLPLAEFLARPALFRALLIAGSLAGLIAAVRIARFGLDRDAGLALALALAAGLLLLIGRLAEQDRGSAGAAHAVRDFIRRGGEHARSLPGFNRLSAVPAALLIASLLLGVVTAPMLWRSARGASGAGESAAITAKDETTPQVDAAGASWTPVQPANVVEGRAVALSGSMLSIGTRKVRLANIEAPEPDQTCSRPGNKRWRCGESAREALSRALRYSRVSCQLSGRPSEDVQEASCTVAGNDVAAALVRSGHVFAAAGLFSAYRNLEREAETQRAGLWAGEAERPAEWRSRMWEDAKRDAPGGCPIKGKVNSGNKLYLLPWSASYGGATVREQRGERWFCSEDEAQAAGWKPGQKS